MLKVAHDWTLMTLMTLIDPRSISVVGASRFDTHDTYDTNDSFDTYRPPLNKC